MVHLHLGTLVDRENHFQQVKLEEDNKFNQNKLDQDKEFHAKQLEKQDKIIHLQYIRLLDRDARKAALAKWEKENVKHGSN
jgi:hypothetical protein